MCSTPWCFGDCEECEADKKYEQERDEAGAMAVKISEMVEPPLTAQEQSFFIAGFCECVKWLGSNDR